MLTIDVLGSLDVSIDGRAVPVTAPRLRTTLAVLALSADHAVSVERLATAVWDDDPPGDARRAVQLYVTRLRGVLGSETIETTPAGYRLRIDPDRVDALRMTRLLDTAATRRFDERALLVEALGLWRGTPFEGLRSTWLDGVAETLTERYLSTLEQRVALDLADPTHLGDPARLGELVAELRDLTARHPLRERFWGHLIVALDRSGRRGDALECYARLRRLLDEELGVEPGPEVRALHRQVLSGEPAAALPRQLPAGVGDFVGRSEGLDQLDALLPGAAPAAVVVGTAGVGKTALAVRWAHRVADKFGDGQLFVNLRGFDPGGRIVEPDEALRGFLSALGVSAHRMPVGQRAQADLFRSLTADKQLLVVLDNARDADQVRPLLPGGSGCRTVVTSRDRLTGLVATEGARAVVLDVLSVDEALDVLSSRLGGGRVAREPEAADEIVAHCARLPLALAIVAARAATQPRLPLAALAAELSDARGRLDALAGVTDVRAVFSWSYQTLRPGAARLFRLLGLHPGPDISAAAAEGLAGGPVGAELAELADANLLASLAPGRYAFHDLLRTYAAELVGRDPAAERRMVDYYLATVEAADRHLHESLGSPEYAEAMAWFDTEQRVLVGLVMAAARFGLDAEVIRLAWALVRFFELTGCGADLVAVNQQGLEAAERLGDLGRQAGFHSGLARTYALRGLLDEARANVAAADALFTQLDDACGRGWALLNLSIALERSRDYTEALDAAATALDLFRSVDDRPGQASALNAVGWFHALLGAYDQALTHCRAAVDLGTDGDDHKTQAASWDSVGYAHQMLGDYRAAIDAYTRALEVATGIGSRQLASIALTHLGDAHQAAGEDAAARSAWRRSLTILEEIDHPDADDVRSRLAG